MARRRSTQPWAIKVSSNAATSTFTSSAAFFAALGPTPFITETFEGFPVGSTIGAGATVNGITFNGFPAGSIGRIDNTFNRIGAQSLALTGSPNFFVQGQAIDVSFAPTTAVGVFFNASPSPLDSLFVQTAVGTAGNGPSYDQSTLFFVGLISDSPFSSARIGATADAQGGFNLDNLTLATRTTPVPEPASMFLLGFGLVALGMRARRSRSL